MNNLILFGHKKCGKSYWGKRLAQEVGYTFIDVDHLVEYTFERACVSSLEREAKPFNKKASCMDIYRRLGEKKFRDLEHEAILSLQGITNCVVALGGGAPLYQKNVDFLKQIGIFIYLKVDKEILKERILSYPLPAFLDESNPKESFESMYEKRTALYEAITAHKILLSGINEDEIMEKLKDAAYGQ